MTSRAMSVGDRARYRSVWERLVRARDILLISPKRPDGDSLGSICGLRDALASVEKPATIFCPDPAPPTFSMLPCIHELIVGNDALRGRTFDVIVICDSGDLVYTGIADALDDWRAPASTLIVIDHHATNTAYGDKNCVITDAASTTEVIARILTANDIHPSPTTATCLLYGLVTDTDGFTNPATSSSAVATAAELMAAGARIGPILRAVYRTKPIDALKLWGRAFERLTINPKWDIATTFLLPEDFADCKDGVERSEGLSNFLQTVIPAHAIMVLKDDGTGIIRGSLRTQRNDVDLGRLAEAIGGGGHRKAAGFGIPGKIVRDGTRWKVA